MSPDAITWALFLRDSSISCNKHIFFLEQLDFSPYQQIFSDSRSITTTLRFLSLAQRNTKTNIVQVLNTVPWERDRFISEDQGNLVLKVSEILSLGVGNARGLQGRAEVLSENIFIGKKVIPCVQSFICSINVSKRWEVPIFKAQNLV